MKKQCVVKTKVIARLSDKIPEEHRSKIYRAINIASNKGYVKRNILIGYIEDSEFLKYLEPYLEKNKSIFDLSSKQLADRLNNFYNNKHRKISNTTDTKVAELLEGFSSMTAKGLAKDHTANIIKEIESREKLKSKKERKSKSEILKSTIAAIRTKYILDYVNPLIESLKENKLMTETISKIEKLREGGNNYSTELMLLYKTVIDKYGDVKDNNYKNLVETILSNPYQWFNQVFTSSKLFQISSSYKQTIESGDYSNHTFEDNNDSIKDESEGIDTYSQNWDNSYGDKSFTSSISSDIKDYFNKLYNLSVWSGEGIFTKDSDNELGVATTMDAGFIIAQLSNIGDFSSVGELINSIEKRAKHITSLYGLSVLIKDMKNDIIFANKIYHELSKFAIKKSTILVREDYATDSQSNKSISPISDLLYKLMNDSKATILDRFRSEDLIKINQILEYLNKNNRAYSPNNENFIKIEEFFKNTLIKYFPRFNSDIINKLLYSDKTDIEILDTFKTLTVNLKDFLNAANTIINYNNENNVLSYDEANNSLINLAKQFINYVPVRNELNSTNAEGNLSSDLLHNNFITNLFKQIAYGNESDINKGLNNLKNTITSLRQYDHSTLFYGIYDDNGNEISPGLFIRNGINVSVNPKAKYLLDVYLFNGIVNETSNDSALYQNMFKGDYFMSQIVAFHEPAIDITRGDVDINLANYFMRTPSDAPKNFVIQAPKISIDGLFITNPIEVEEAISKVENSYNLKNIINNKTISNLIKNSIKSRNNKIRTINDLLDLLENNIDSFVFTGMKSVTVKDITYVPIHYINDVNERVTVILKGKAVTNTDSNQQILTVESKELFINNSDKKLPKEIRDVIKDKEIIKGNINQTIDKNHGLFRGFYSNLFGELDTFIRNLNYITDNKHNIIKTTDDLIDRYHYNGEILKDGKFTGNVFRFFKLFKTKDYNVEEELIRSVSLYGGIDESISRSIIKGTKIDVSHDLISYSNKTYSLNYTNELKQKLEDIVSNWILSYSKNIVNRTKQYDYVIKDNYNYSQIQEALINYSLTYMSFDDIFEGNYKFYKDVQTFLKRAKEVQAAGMSYANQLIGDSLNGDIHNISDNSIIEVFDENGNLVPYLTPHRGNNSVIAISPMTPRNGFRGITINNVVRASKNAKGIYEDLLRVGVNEILAKKIAKGYGYENGNKTIADDAQSYITLEEFISRTYADGSFNQYKDLFQKLLDPNIPIEDINVDDVMSKIQVQKNFYYDIQIHAKTNTAYPRQIKNAEYVLIPKLIKGTTLETLYNIMNKYDIGQVNTAEATKAAKRNVLTFWDNEGNVSNLEEFENLIADENNTNVVENYYYRYLYKQQVVHDHIVDEVNKVGLQISKKIHDNASEKTKIHSDNLFKSYVTNIKEDFNTLLDVMGWKTDRNGNIINKVGSNELLDFTEFYSKARREAQRLGMDSNFIAYLTPNELGHPDLPNYMGTVSRKIESIAQSIFNNLVTRQKLPGWHSAQITGVGKDVNLQYHPRIYIYKDQEVSERDLRNLGLTTESEGVEETDRRFTYSEIILPSWSSAIPKNYSIEDLTKEGLDMHMGYRIPTEGKQSIALFKVVDIMDSIEGSSIIIPDEWVAQTGSDFDVDSIYGIRYELKSKNGIVKKISFIEEITEENIEQLYIDYVNSKLIKKVKFDNITGKEIKDKISEAKNKIKDINSILGDTNGIKSLYDFRNEVYKTLPNEDKKDIIEFNKLNKEISDLYRATALYDIYLNKYNETADLNLKELYLNFAYANKDIADLLTIYENVGIVKENNKTYNKLREDYIKEVKKIAKENDIISIEDFAKLSIEEQNNRAARNNRIIDSMIAIMEDDNSREENYSRSNFDDLIESKNEIDKLKSKQNKLDGVDISINRSVYNPLDQIDFMENAMSGAKLKGMSVYLDGFVSVNNYTRSELGKNYIIEVEYEDNGRLDFNNIKAAYTNSQKTNKNSIIVSHDSYGNSKNNRNVTGQLITTYSSQTTAHTLDAVKEGFIHNQNDYTFQPFKMLINVGVDFRTAIAFLQQAGIDKIIEANFNIKSLYSSNSGNPIYTALKNIINELGITDGGVPISQYTSNSKMMEILTNNKELKQAFIRLFGVGLDFENGHSDIIYRLDEKRLISRYNYGKNYNNFDKTKKDNTFETKYELAAFDISVILLFNKLIDSSRLISNIASVTNSDKFGAKQTVRSTKNIITNISKYKDPKSEESKILRVGESSFLNSLYPTDENGVIQEFKSSYPSLAAFMKYATISSVNINSELFDIESSKFNFLKDSIETHIGRALTDIEYLEFKQYLMTDIYNSIQMLSTPYTIQDNKVEYDINNLSENKWWSNEKTRIYGFNPKHSNNFVIKDINNISNEELNKFKELTPIQKVLWIQTNFNEDSGIFNKLNTNIFNNNEFEIKGYSIPKITYSDQIDDIENLFIEFNEAYFNSNPLIKLAAIDLIKYAFIVEGYDFKKGYISKLITKEALLDKIVNNESLIDVIKFEFSRYSTDYENINRFVNNFVRSHSSYIREYKLPKDKTKTNGQILTNIETNRVGVNKEMLYIESNNIELLEYFEIDLENGGNKSYIKINNPNKKSNPITLYKLHYRLDENGDNVLGIVLYPINTLEVKESDDYSINNGNNRYKTEKYYKTIIGSIIDKSYTLNETDLLMLDKDETIPYHEKAVNTVLQDNINAIIDMSTSSDNLISSNAIEFIYTANKAYEEYMASNINSRIIFINNSKNISYALPTGEQTIQMLPITTIDINGDQFTKLKPFKIIKLKSYELNNKFNNPNFNFAKNQLDNLSTSINNFYEIVPLEESKFAITDMIEEIANIETSKSEEIITTTKDIFNDLKRIDKIERNKYSEEFVNLVESKRIDEFDSVSLNENKTEILTSAANYYRSKATMITDNINKFDLDDPNLYKLFEEDSIELRDFIKSILEARVFGERFNYLFNMDITGETPELQKAIEDIKNAINKVKNNSNISKAIQYLFDVYLTNKFSNNPLLKMGVLNARDQFGDTSWLDKNFAAISEIPNSQVQLVLKYMYSKVNAAIMVDAPKILEDFNDTVIKIEAMDGDINWENIIRDGKLRTNHTDDFIKDYENIKEELENTRINYGEYSKEYILASYKRDKFRENYVEQLVINDYYKEINDNLGKLLFDENGNINNDNLELYVEYKKIIKSLSDIPIETKVFDKVILRKKATNRINNLISKYNLDYTEKTNEEITAARALKEFIETKKLIDKKYYDKELVDGFQELLNENLEVIRKYDEELTPNEPLENKLKHEEYKNAYNFIKSNTFYTLNEESSDKIHKAFKILSKEENLLKIKINDIILKYEAYDEYGNQDPTKLPKEAIKEIKKLIEDFNNDKEYVSLIKETPKNDLIYNDEFYKEFSNDGIDIVRKNIVLEINTLISKGINEKGEIDSHILFNKLTKKELERLGELYTTLRRHNKTNKHKVSDKIEFKVNQEAFDREFIFFENLRDDELKAIWMNIFVQTTSNNSVDGIKPNNSIFGYSTPKEKYLDEFVNIEKTEAKRLLDSSIEYVVTDAYRQAETLAINEGIYNEWYDDNHIYDVKTNSMKPISIWTEMKVNVNTEYGISDEYLDIPTFDNYKRKINDEFKNSNYVPKKISYNNSGKYNNLKINDKEQAMLDLFRNILESTATTTKTKNWVTQGNAPTKAKGEHNTSWYINQTLGTVGLSFNSYKDNKYTDIIDASHDFEPEFDMLSEIKTKGYKSRREIPIKGSMSDEAYKKLLDEVKAENKEIDSANRKLHNEALNNDWINVFRDYIPRIVEHTAKQEAKYMGYLLLEDLKNNPAYKIGRFSGNVIADMKKSTADNTVYRTVDQKNTYEMFENYLRRFIFNEFKKDSKLNSVAGFLQNLTSAKYMALNITGGVNNLLTGWSNIIGEVLARDYFTNGEYTSAQIDYLKSSIQFISDAYSPTSNNFNVAVSKWFDLINPDQISEQASNESVSEYINRVRNGLYVFQTGTEHYLHNTVLFAALKSHKVYVDKNNKTKVVNFGEYSWELEYEIMNELLKDNKALKDAYIDFVSNIKNNKIIAEKYSSLKRSINSEFIRLYNLKDLQKEFIKLRKERVKNLKEEFNSLPTLESQFEVDKGYAKLKKDSKVSAEEIGSFKQRVKTINDKLHGIYDKVGGALIEREWWGSLVTQYHKHLYPGFMKRYRSKGYYNELRGTHEKGSFVSLMQLLTLEIKDSIGKTKGQINENDNNTTIDNVALSIQNIALGVYNTIANLKTNYNTLERWEQNNIRRALQDAYSILGMLALTIALHIATEEDELEDNTILATALYISDRFISQSQAFLPWGVITEARTLWSSPIAALNAPQELIKGLTFVYNWATDSEFNPYYTTGLYRGDHKGEVLLRRNIPIVRVYDRIKNMPRNNNYYRGTSNGLEFISPKDIADSITND